MWRKNLNLLSLESEIQSYFVPGAWNGEVVSLNQISKFESFLNWGEIHSIEENTFAFSEIGIWKDY